MTPVEPEVGDQSAGHIQQIRWLAARRTRRWMLAGGTSLMFLIASTFLLSAWWYIVLQVPTPLGPCIYLENGATMVSLHRRLDEGEWIHLERSTEGLSLWNAWTGGWRSRVVEVPLYAVFLGVAIPTFVVWKRRPVRAPSLCHCCGYNLTGNVSGRCPECGAVRPASP